MYQKGIQTDLYKQLQETMIKLDSLSDKFKTIEKDTCLKVEKKFKDKITKLKNAPNDIYVEINNKFKSRIENLEFEVTTLKQQNKELKNRNDFLEVENVKLKNDVDRLKKQINNDSNNSSNPPSSDIKKNIPNSRNKSSKKIGAQIGHKPHFLSKEDVKSKIEAGEFKHKVANIGKVSDKYISKYIIDIEVSVIANEYRFYIDKNGKYNIPKKFQSDVQYGSELKTMCAVLNTEGVVAIDRLTDFVSSISHGKLNISNGTIINFLNTLSVKSAPIIQNIKDNILNSQLMHTDATTARCDNKNISVRNYSTKTDTLLIATKGKSKKDIEQTNILPIYTGNIIHDHETLMYRYGNKHGECNVHISRYLTGCFENTKNDWSVSMRSFLCCINEYKKSLINKENNCITKDKLETYSLRYDEILKKGYEQNEKTKSKYCKKEEIKLLNRLSKYKQNHLLFINDFTIPFDNNLSERDLRHVKNKQKISGYFKSMQGAQSYLNVKSIISTCKKRGKDFYKEIFNIYQNNLVSI